MIESPSPRLRLPTAPLNVPSNDNQTMIAIITNTSTSPTETNRKLTPSHSPHLHRSTETTPTTQQSHNNLASPDLTNIELNVEPNSKTPDTPQDGHNHASMKGSGVPTLAESKSNAFVYALTKTTRH
jgi:hypothetical protein